MSIAGLTRCFGVAKATIQGILTNAEAGSTIIEKLKLFAGKIFINLRGAGSENKYGKQTLFGRFLFMHKR